MSEYKIEKGVPTPHKTDRVYPFSQMEIGDSFFIPNLSTSDGRYQSVSSAGRGQFKRHNKKFSMRSENGGVRVWRIA